MIHIENLKKSFGCLDVLKDVSLSVRPSTVKAIIGPNSSGKSTLMKCILGLVRPDSGDIRMQGQSIINQWAYREYVGYFPQIVRFPQLLTVKDIFSIMKDMRSSFVGSYDLELFEMFGLHEFNDQYLGNLSGGTLQKVCAALCYLFSPRLVILDEPTVGLDPLSASILREKILRTQKTLSQTVILTSHILSDVASLATEMVYLLDGKIRFDGSIQALLTQTSAPTLDAAIVQLMKEEPNVA